MVRLAELNLNTELGRERAHLLVDLIERQLAVNFRLPWPNKLRLGPFNTRILFFFAIALSCGLDVPSKSS